MTESPYRAFRHPPFAAFMVLRACAVIPSEIVLVAVGWQLYALTGSAMALGFIGLCQALPVIALAPWAGHLADRLDRRALLFAAHLAHLAGAVALFALASLDHPPVWTLYAVLTWLGAARAFQGPAGSALLPALIPFNLLPTAMTWSTTAFQLFVIAGPLLGGVMIGMAGVGGAYGLAALLLAAGSFAFVRLPSGRAPVAVSPAHEGRWAGAKFVWTHPVLFGAVLLDLLAVLFGGATALLPLFAKDILHVGPEGLGVLKAATGAGSFVTGFALLHRPPLQRVGATFLACVAIYGAAMTGFGWSTSFWLSCFCLWASGAADGVSVVIRHVLAATVTPDPLRGRVSAILGVFIQSSNKLGEFESGVAAAWLGAAPSVVAGGLVTLAMVSLIAWRVPALRRLDTIRP